MRYAAGRSTAGPRRRQNPGQAPARRRRRRPGGPVRTVTAAIDIDASPMAVWAVLADLGRYPEWNPRIREGTGEVAAGSRLTLKVYDPGRLPVTIHPLVLAAEPGVEWRSVGGIPGIVGRLIFSGEHRVALAPAGEGTRLVRSETFRGILVPFLGKALSAAEASFREQNEALKNRVEAGRRET
ncbi:MAG: SRPBCC family protein [Streptosporangiaceae bacterium]